MKKIDLQGELLREFHDPRHGIVGANVLDLTNDAIAVSFNADMPLVMASVTKIFTIGALLEKFGPSGTVATELRARSVPDSDGVLDDDLYVVGGGDPTLGSEEFVRSAFRGAGTTADQIAEVAVRSGISAIRGSVIGDRTPFSEEKGLSSLALPLTYEQTRDKNPAFAAAHHISAALAAHGVEVASPAGAGRPDAGTRLLGSRASPPLISMLTKAGHDSDNRVTETLAQAMLAESVEPPDVGGAIAAIRAHAAEYGATIDIVNASGLSRANLASPETITRYLAALSESEIVSDLIRTLPRAGHDGTLRDRMRNTAAAERVWAKTGTLLRAGRPVLDALAGFAFGPQRSVAFSLVLQGADSRYAAKSSIDRMTDAIARFCN